MRFDPACLFKLEESGETDALGNPQYKLIEIERIKARVGEFTLREVDLIQRRSSQATLKAIYRGNNEKAKQATHFGFLTESKTVDIYQVQDVEVGRKWNTLYLSDWKAVDKYDGQDILFL